MADTDRLLPPTSHGSTHGQSEAADPSGCTPVSCKQSADWRKILGLLLAVTVATVFVVVFFATRSAFEHLWFEHQRPNCTRTRLLPSPFQQTNLSAHSQYGPNPYGEYSVTLSMLLQLLHIPEFCALFCGCCGYVYRRKSVREVDIKLCQKCCTCCSQNERSWKCCIRSCKCCCDITVWILLLLLYIFVGLAIGIFQLPLTYCKTDAPLGWLPAIRGFLTMGAHILTFLARAFMVWQCIKVHSTFWKEITDPTTRNAREPNPLAEASMIHKSLTEQYTEVADEVRPVIEIFTSWFFVMWILYTIGTISNLVYLLRIWFLNVSLSDTELTYEILYIVYNLLSYGIPYILALKLKAYHKEYYKQLKYKQVTIIAREDHHVYGYATTMPIMKRDDCDFVPSILSITLPLESIQFAIPVLLPVISLTMGFLKP